MLIHLDHQNKNNEYKYSISKRFIYQFFFKTDPSFNVPHVPIMKIKTTKINIQSEKDLFMNSFWKLTNNSMSRMSPSWKINTKRITTTSEREIYKLFLKTNQSFNVPHVPIMKINTTKINIQSEKDLFMNSFSKLINHSMSRMSPSSK